MSIVILSDYNISQYLTPPPVNSKIIQINYSNDNSHYAKKNILGHFQH